jgi:serine/threonine-protein kinase
MAVELNPSSTFAGYRIERKLARGGMGVVYRAARIADGASVALKVIDPEHAADARFRRRFEREGRIAAGLDHPHLVPLFDAGVEDGVPFLAMAFIEGTDLEALLAERGPLHPRLAAAVVSQVGGGLDAAHGAGLVHRDVKPGNVLLEPRDGGVHAYLTDFGLSKQVDSQSGLTRTGHWVGTLDYAAPEQLQAEATDHRTDIYGLGCVLHEALTGTVPYPRSRDVDKMIAHITGPPPKASELNPAVPKAFDEVVGRAMATLPDDRYQSGGALAGAALIAAEGSGPEPTDPIGLTPPGRSVDSDAPTAG